MASSEDVSSGFHQKLKAPPPSGATPDLRPSHDDDQVGGSGMTLVDTANPGLALKVAEHYNNLDEKGKEQRKQSRIYYMRNFNNWIKSMLLQEYVEKMKRSHRDLWGCRNYNDHRGFGSDNRQGRFNEWHDYPNGSNLRSENAFSALDLGCGKGGDLLKWSKAGIDHLTCVDIAEISVNQARSRYEDMKRRNRGRIFSADFLTADCTRTLLSDIYPTRSTLQTFDIVSCQFAFHYSFESAEQAECMIRNAAERLKPGGFFIGTTPDAKVILDRRKQRGDQFGNSIYRIEFDPHKEKDTTLGDTGFGVEYNFHLEGVVDCPEFLVDFGLFCEIAERHNLILVGKQGFENFFRQKRESPEGGRLLRQIKALEPYPPSRTGQLVAGDRSNYVVAEEFLARYEGRKEGDPWQSGEPVYMLDKRDPVLLGTLSQEEWEAITLYLVFAFKKRSELKNPNTAATSSLHVTEL